MTTPHLPKKEKKSHRGLTLLKRNRLLYYQSLVACLGVNLTLMNVHILYFGHCIHQEQGMEVILVILGFILCQVNRNLPLWTKNV